MWLNGLQATLAVTILPGLIAFSQSFSQLFILLHQHSSSHCPEWDRKWSGIGNEPALQSVLPRLSRFTRKVMNSSPAWHITELEHIWRLPWITCQLIWVCCRWRLLYWCCWPDHTGCLQHAWNGKSIYNANLISSKPPYDNYYNISKAVYPSVDLPSLMIKITVTFLHGNGNLTHLAGTSRSPINGSTSNISQTGGNVRETTETKITTYQFTWSASCLYVSGGNINLTSMNVFSLWAIYPNRRERHALNIATVLQRIFCGHYDLLPFHGRTFSHFIIIINLSSPSLSSWSSSQTTSSSSSLSLRVEGTY